jgi:deoxyribodipyrimidine photolyase-related protein
LPGTNYQLLVTNHQVQTSMRHVVLVLGDQLTFSSLALEGFDPEQDCILMIEAPGESTEVWSHKARIAIFLSAMRHFIHEVSERGWPFVYVQLDESAEPSFGARLRDVLCRFRPQALRMVEAGEWRMQQEIAAACHEEGVVLQVFDDTHFMCSRSEFERWAGGKKELRMEFFYRVMRRQYNVLMDGAEPHGGQWNFDIENRSAYPKRNGPGRIPDPAGFEPDETTRQVLALVQKQFPEHPGLLENFRWPVQREQALEALHSFIDHRLIQFGTYQDAMWTDTPFGWHSLLSAALNVHLLDPREVIAAAEEAYRKGLVPLQAAEGFIRQILGWREFIRGVYWLDMPEMKDANHFGHQRTLPHWFWNGETKMACMHDSLKQTLAFGYAHHIQRLMVIGNFATLAELSPRQVSDWFLAIYVDAVEWVELPNTLGMALHACGSRFTSKPYVASGAYIGRQSNYCSGCHYDPTDRTGQKACPFTTLYWNFIERHQQDLAASPRTALMAKNLQKLSAEERSGIEHRAAQMLENLEAL